MLYKEVVPGTTHPTPCGGVSMQVITQDESERDGAPAFYHRRAVKIGRWKFKASTLCWPSAEPSAVITIEVPPKFEILSTVAALAIQKFMLGFELPMYEPDLEEALVTLDEVCETFRADMHRPSVSFAELLKYREEAGIGAHIPVDLEEDVALIEGDYINYLLSRHFTEIFYEDHPNDRTFRHLTEEQVARGVSAFLDKYLKYDPKVDAEDHIIEAGYRAVNAFADYLVLRKMLPHQAA